MNLDGDIRGVSYELSHPAADIVLIFARTALAGRGRTGLRPWPTLSAIEAVDRGAPRSASRRVGARNRALESSLFPRPR